jgi:hypothetical protein
VVPKKAEITVIKNKENELVPTRVQSGWQVCIDYKKLNSGIRKDHFPLPFRLAMLITVSLMATLATIKFRWTQKIRKRPLLLVPSVRLPIAVCLLVYAMHLLLFNGV